MLRFLRCSLIVRIDSAVLFERSLSGIQEIGLSLESLRLFEPLLLLSLFRFRLHHDHVSAEHRAGARENVLMALLRQQIAFMDTGRALEVMRNRGRGDIAHDKPQPANLRHVRTERPQVAGEDRNTVVL